ncbi:hypothetical protein QJS04_geneDACA008936 [Acorus gramineus]|uniref:Protein CYCLOPS n=1 Tax=Acorus gramineus TaxID=55184 RepID=A0AAV9AB26_ACOGR|nr:hypothetical protein QJS04_geneDACA008936 [Acorus gramineus]
MEGRGYSDLYRNSSEELFLKSLMESSVGMPSMEMLGLKNISQPFRVDSEELFNSWLNNGEASEFVFCRFCIYSIRNDHGEEQIRSKKNIEISTELPSLSQQDGTADQKKGADDNLLQQNFSMLDDLSNDPNQQSLRNTMEKGIQGSNLYLAKNCFCYEPLEYLLSSNSTTLEEEKSVHFCRRRYAAMQNNQTSLAVEAKRNIAAQATNRTPQDFATTSNFCDVSMGEIPNQLGTSLTSHFDTPPVTVDTVSSVVSMLKGTLERKKHSNHIDNGMVEGGTFRLYDANGVTPNMSYDQEAVNQILGPLQTFQVLSPIQVKEAGNSRMAEGSAKVDIEGLLTENQIQMHVVSQEPSQSESSAPALSTGFDVCDGPTNSGQALSACESSRKSLANGTSEYVSNSKDFRERIFDNNLKNQRKRGNLVRMGSVTSGTSVDRGDSTKKRRVERSRKMAEAKERNSTPTVPSDMQSVLKRCENLEREVRSLKLNLSFMNRYKKDSEQTKQIEDLEKQNEDLIEEKERLLEEIERIISDPRKI